MILMKKSRKDKTTSSKPTNRFLSTTKQWRGEEPQQNLQIQTHLGSESDQREGAAAPDRLVGGTYFTMGGAYRATSHHCSIKFGTLFDPVRLQENYHPNAIKYIAGTWWITKLVGTLLNSPAMRRSCVCSEWSRNDGRVARWRVDDVLKEHASTVPCLLLWSSLLWKDLQILCKLWRAGLFLLNPECTPKVRIRQAVGWD